MASRPINMPRRQQALQAIALMIGVFVAVTAAPGANAADMTLEELNKLVQEQTRQIKLLSNVTQTLSRELAETRSQLAQTDQKVVVATEQLDATADYIDNVATANGHGPTDGSWSSRTSVGGYGELHYNNVDADDSARDFKEADYHRFVAFLNHEFSPSIRFFSEVELEHSLVADTADGSNGGEVELEQAYLEMDLNRNHKMKTGLFLLPIGLLNETHEPPTFYGVERNDVENIILPATWWEAGVGFSGQYASGFSWDAAVHTGLQVPTTGGSALRIRSGRQKVANANAEDLAYTFRGRYTGVPGLELGASFQHQSDISQFGGDGLDDANLIALHGVYSEGPFSIRGLWARWDINGALAEFMNADEQTGWYLEPSVKFEHWLGTDVTWGVYARFEDVEGARGQDQFDQWELGVNLWPTSNVVFKLDLRDREHDLGTDRGRNFTALDLGVGYQF